MKKYKVIFWLLMLICGLQATLTQAQKKSEALNRPKLVVGIVVDQMRYDYLYRYWDKYGKGGFKRLIQDGFSYENHHFNYEPTVTGAGHASIYTGTSPSIHGIIGNNWYDRETGKNVYCTEDDKVAGVGGAAEGKMSPVNMQGTTITDELRLATNMQSKVIGVCIKDRGSILPAGHSANAAYWYDGTNGNWITSTYYMASLPTWVQQFNARKLTDVYLSKPWTTLLPIAQYTESTPDDNEFERPFATNLRPVFPHDLPALRGKDYGLIRSTPFGNSLTKNFAIETIKAEQMGKGSQTDFLALSFSSTDYIGHQFGPNSIEVEDTYLRLDRDLAEFLKFLDTQVGKNNYLVFLTADHGASSVVSYAQSVKLPTGLANFKQMQDSLSNYLNQQYGKANWVEYFINQQIYLNHSLVNAKKINLAEMQTRAADYLIRFKGVLKTTTAVDLRRSIPEASLESFMFQGYNRRRSGDIIVTMLPGWYGGGSKGTGHSTPYAYDTHVPLLWYGWGVEKGVSSTRVSITDIAPTLAQFLRITEPNGTTGHPLKEVLGR